jgi:transposase-like protein
MILNSTKFVNWKVRKPLCTDLKHIYQASTIDEAETALLEFSKKWNKKTPKY